MNDNESLDIREVMNEIQKVCDGRISRQNKYFQVCLKALDAVESRTPGFYRQDLLDKLTQLAEVIKQNKDVAQAAELASRGKIKKLYKRFLFSLLRPLIIHQQHYNGLMADYIDELRNAVRVLYENSIDYPALQEITSDLIRGVLLLHEEEIQAKQAAMEERVEAQARALEDKTRQLEQTAKGINEIQTRLSEQVKKVEQLEQVNQWLKVQITRYRWNTEDRLTKLQEEIDGIANRGKKLVETPTRYYRPTLEFDLADFERQMRGESQEIKTKFRTYLPYFKGCNMVLDAGCGAGEFLELLRDQGIDGYGVDLDKSLLEQSRAKELQVVEADVIEHLRDMTAESIDGLFAAQLIEHLDFKDMVTMIRLAYEKLKPGSPIILETVNTTCLTIYSGSFYANPTHLRPVHPVTLQYILNKIGFKALELKLVSPFPDEERLQLVEPVASQSLESTNGTLQKIARIIDKNSEKINNVLFSYADYAVIARKP